jgi:uncharacterized protein (DUF4415 family)
MKKSKPKTLDELRAMKDEDIDFSEIPEADEEFWKRAKVKHPQPKQTVNIRLDAEVLDFFKAGGPGYQTRINSVLRSYVVTMAGQTNGHTPAASDDLQIEAD